MAEKTKKHHFGYFSARLLWALEPFVQHHREMGSMKMLDGNIFIEPSSAGGVLIGALHGHAMAVFHDPDGYASGTLTLDMPDDAFIAAAPKAPLLLEYCGTRYTADMPDWMQPGLCCVYDAGMHVATKMRHPQWADVDDDEFYPALFSTSASFRDHYVGRDYRMKEGSPVDWKTVLAKVLATTPTATPEVTAMMPQIVGLFSRIVDMCMTDADPDHQPHVFHRATGGAEAPGAIVLTIENRPDFFGCYMPMSAAAVQPVSWHFLHKERANG